VRRELQSLNVLASVARALLTNHVRADETTDIDHEVFLNGFVANSAFTLSMSLAVRPATNGRRSRVSCSLSTRTSTS